MQNIPNDFPIRLTNPRAWRTYIGGARLDALHGNPNGTDGHFPEEWIMSTVSARNAGREHIKDEGMCYVALAPETSLAELLGSEPEYYLGKAHCEKTGASLGVLVKLIDSAERLTLQVHPDRKRAMELFGSPFGKTECWHILEAREVNGVPPMIYLGFKEHVTRDLWKKLFDEQDIPGMLDAMRSFEVSPGDTILIEGGMPHAIGSGCFLVEIQEPTDFTIRVERTTPAGFAVDDFMCHQGLGFERMMDAFHYDSMSADYIRSRWFIPQKALVKTDGGSVTELIGYDSTKLFRLCEVNVTDKLTVDCPDVFSGLYILDGSGTLTANGKSVHISKTEQFFVPYLTGRMEFTADTPLRIMSFFGAE